MNKIEIRVDPNTGLTSSVKLGGVEIGQSVRSVTFHHEGGNWPTLTLDLVSNDVLLDVPIETLTLTQPAYCRGGSNCGRDRRGLWHCNCLNQSKQEPRKQRRQ